MTTHGNLFYNTWCSADSLGFREDDVLLGLFSPHVHPHDLFMRPLLLGGASVLLRSNTPRGIMKAVRTHPVTCLMAVPSTYWLLFSYRRFSREHFARVRLLECGGGLPSATLLAMAGERTGKHLTPVWGSTETCGVAIATPPAMPPRPGNIGFPIPLHEVTLLDESGKSDPALTRGEMVVHGPSVCAQYVATPTPSSVLSGGSYRTGDVVARERDGSLRFVGRLGGAMKIGGHTVYPEEVEAVILAHPDVVSAAVFSIPDALHGEICRAMVTLRTAVRVDAEHIRRHCAERLPPLICPRNISIVSRLPSTPQGKIDRQACRTWEENG